MLSCKKISSVSLQTLRSIIIQILLYSFYDSTKIMSKFSTTVIFQMRIIQT